LTQTIGISNASERLSPAYTMLWLNPPYLNYLGFPPNFSYGWFLSSVHRGCRSQGHFLNWYFYSSQHDTHTKGNHAHSNPGSQSLMSARDLKCEVHSRWYVVSICFLGIAFPSHDQNKNSVIQSIWYKVLTFKIPGSHQYNDTLIILPSLTPHETGVCITSKELDCRVLCSLASPRRSHVYNIIFNHFPNPLTDAGVLEYVGKYPL